MNEVLRWRYNSGNVALDPNPIDTKSVPVALRSNNVGYYRWCGLCDRNIAIKLNAIPVKILVTEYRETHQEKWKVLADWHALLGACFISENNPLGDIKLIVNEKGGFRLVPAKIQSLAIARSVD